MNDSPRDHKTCIETSEIPFSAVTNKFSGEAFVGLLSLLKE